MSALNMAMNGNAYKMIEIKKVSGPVVPLRDDFKSNQLTMLFNLCKVGNASYLHPVT